MKLFLQKSFYYWHTQLQNVPIQNKGCIGDVVKMTAILVAPGVGEGMNLCNHGHNVQAVDSENM